MGSSATLSLCMQGAMAAEQRAKEARNDYEYQKALYDLSFWRRCLESDRKYLESLFSLGLI